MVADSKAILLRASMHVRRCGMWDKSEPSRIDPFRTGKAYSVLQAARLAGTTTATVRRWLAVYELPQPQMAPVFGESRLPSGEAAWSVSFLQLVEIVIVARFRQGTTGHSPVTLERLRRAHAFARLEFRSDYPFASRRLRDFGGHILHDFHAYAPGEAAIVLDLDGHGVLPGAVRAELVHFEYADELVSRWYPAGKNGPIVVDPRIAAGRPTVVGSGVTVDTIRKRFGAGQSIAFIAQDFALPPAVVERVLQLTTIAA
jgi:uncharacterized protein (DUF433 family)